MMIILCKGKLICLLIIRYSEMCFMTKIIQAFSAFFFYFDSAAKSENKKKLFNIREGLDYDKNCMSVPFVILPV